MEVLVEEVEVVTIKSKIRSRSHAQSQLDILPRRNFAQASLNGLTVFVPESCAKL